MPRTLQFSEFTGPTNGILEQSLGMKYKLRYGLKPIFWSLWPIFLQKRGEGHLLEMVCFFFVFLAFFYTHLL